MRPTRTVAVSNKKATQFRIAVIGIFSFALLGGLLMHRAHPLGQARSAKSAVDSAAAGAGRRELHLGNHQGVVADDAEVLAEVASQPAEKVKAPDAPQGTVEAPAPHVLVTGNDARHPDNIKAMMSGQSHATEHRSSLVQTLIRGREDVAVKTTDKKKKAGEGAGKETAKEKAEVKAEAKAGATESKAESNAADVVSTTTTTTAIATASSTGDKRPTVAEYNGGTTTAAGPGCKKAGYGCGLDGYTIHTLFTSNGSPYQNFQARIMVATWKQVRAQPDGKHLVAMTRILHRTTDDELMDEVDTFRADPLQPECDKWCWFPVADRANAFQQYLNAIEANPSMQKAPWLLLLETDYVWIKPLHALGDCGNPNTPGLSFAFDYIGPLHNHYVEQMLRDECSDCHADTVPNSGPAPVLSRFEDFKVATPVWERLSKWIETHEDAKKALGWVREMYAWDVGVAAGRLKITNQGPPTSTLIAQPPHDLKPGNASMYHYTWGSIFRDKNGTDVWKFDKRTYVDVKDVWRVPKIPLPPPYREGLKLHDGMPVSKDLHATLTHMLTLMNSAIETLPDLTEHAQDVKTKQQALDAAVAAAKAAKAADKKTATT